MTQEMSAMSNTLWTRFGKRVFDLVVGSALVILLSPLLVFTGTLVKLSSRGLVFFAQDRAGKDGVIFRAIKFRTMRADRTPDPKELVPLEHADITPLGWLLRRFKIDELPQLLYVLTGQMSLVGPRPTLPDQVAAYDDFRRQRVLVRPGLTGLAQVYGNAEVSWDERILFDIVYVRRCSFVMDLGIFLRTVVTLLLGERHTTRPFQTTLYARYVTPPQGYPFGVNAIS